MKVWKLKDLKGEYEYKKHVLLVNTAAVHTSLMFILLNTSNVFDSLFGW